MVDISAKALEGACAQAQIPRLWLYCQVNNLSVGQVERLVDDLACAVSADLDGIAANYELLFGVNTVSRAEFLHMQQELATWQPLIKVLCSSLHPHILYSNIAAGFLWPRIQIVEGVAFL